MSKKLIPKTESTVRAYTKRMEWMKEEYKKTKKQIIKSKEIYLDLLQKKATVNKGGWCTSAIQYFRQEAGLERYGRNVAKEAGITNIGGPRKKARRRRKSKKLEESSSSGSSSSSSSSGEGSDTDESSDEERIMAERLEKVIDAIDEHSGPKIPKKTRVINATYRFMCPVPKAGGLNQLDSTRKSRSAWRNAGKLAMFQGVYAGYNEEAGSKCIAYIAKRVEDQLPDDVEENYVVDRLHIVGNLLGLKDENVKGGVPPVNADWFLQATNKEKAYIKAISEGHAKLDHMIVKSLEVLLREMESSKLKGVQEGNDCAALTRYFLKKFSNTVN